MTNQLMKINLSQIRLETCFRDKEKDLSLELDISRNGLRKPLTVEKESESKYVLVDGYRRFYALQFLGIERAECIVECLTSEEARIIKRLGNELHTKKKTAYQLERMIKQLESKKYSVERIAKLCNVTKETIAQYSRGSDVNPEWIRRADVANAGRHALTDIHNLKVSNEMQEYIVDKYINKEINRDAVLHIKKAVKVKAFEQIPESNIKEFVDQIIETHANRKDTVKQVVHENSLSTKYTKKSHLYMHHIVLKLLQYVEKIFLNPYYVDYLSVKQKGELTKLLKKLTIQLNPPIVWRDFPDDKHKKIKSCLK